MTDDLVRSQENQVLMLYGDPGQMGNWSAEPCGGLPFDVPYKDAKRWNPAGDRFRELCRKAFGVTT